MFSAILALIVKEFNAEISFLYLFDRESEELELWCKCIFIFKPNKWQPLIFVLFSTISSKWLEYRKENQTSSLTHLLPRGKEQQYNPP